MNQNNSKSAPVKTFVDQADELERELNSIPPGTALDQIRDGIRGRIYAVCSFVRQLQRNADAANATIDELTPLPPSPESASEEQQLAFNKQCTLCIARIQQAIKDAHRRPRALAATSPRSIAIVKLQEAIMWLDVDFKEWGP